MILGLDVSTSYTGYCVLDPKTKEIKLRGAVRTTPRKAIKDNYDKANLVEKTLKEIRKNHDISSIFIEKPLERVAKGFGSGKTIATLWFYNGLISYQCLNLFNIKPVHLMPRAARKAAGLKMKKGLDVKDQVLKFILGLYPDITPDLNRNNKIAAHNYDMADSVVVALAGHNELGKKASPS